jgi:MoxR-like ATPase
MLVALFAGGHILLEGPPGTAKTLIAHSFARAVSARFRPHPVHAGPDAGRHHRRQPVQLPDQTFTLTRGPIFTELLLADEINRTPPKTQAPCSRRCRSARSPSTARPQLGDRFMVVATQNPIEQQGVYPLPEAQLDRFLFKQTVDYPSAEEERRIVATHGARQTAMEPEQWGIERKADAAAIAAAHRRGGERSGWSTR